VSFSGESNSPDLVLGREALLNGDPHAAAQILEPLVGVAPSDIEARYWLASARLTAGHPSAAQAMEDARVLQTLMQLRLMGVDIARLQTDAAYASTIAEQLYAQKCVAMSGVVRRVSCAAQPLDAQGLLSYGLALQHQGRAEEACQAFAAADEAAPSAAVAQFRIYPQLLFEDGEARHLAAARDWAKRFAPGAPSRPHSSASRRGRKLRVGYVAPWFANSQLRQFIAPLLEHHDPESVSVTLYPNDASTEADWPPWIDIHPLGGLDDAQAAALIRSDAIDVLADCWGHSAGSRLSVFAFRPAPVQVAWMNYIQTTGLEQMDYVLHADGAHHLPKATGHYTEQIWRIGPVFNAFRPQAGRLPASSTPALKSGQVTFGSFNHPAKLSGAALDAWAAALRGAPSSRLLLKYSYFIDPVLRRVTQARLAARGVAPERIAFAGHSSGADYLRAFQDVDLMFDAWPAPGSTTTLDALSNGTPVLVKAANDSGALYARSILEACGLPELIADSADDFARLAIELAHDTQRLDALRARVRPGFDNGPLADEPGFSRRIEAAFAEMFDAWFAERRGRQAHG
jgi:protein O-GlcNAc transferase